MDVIFSVVMLASFIWVVRVMLPKAIKEQSGLALTSAVLAAILALVAWLLVCVAVRSASVSSELSPSAPRSSSSPASSGRLA